MLSYNPNLMTPGTNRLFIEGAREAAPDSYVPVLSTVQNSTKQKESYPHLGDAPAMIQFRDEVIFSPMSDKLYELTNRKYTAGISLLRDDVEDDQVGGFPERVQDLGMESVLLPNYELMLALINGDASGNNSYDGVTFFNASHPALGPQGANEGGVQTNLKTGTGTTVAQIKTDLNVTLAQMRGLKRENGRYANINMRDIGIVFPPAIRETMLEALRSQEISNTTNVSLRGINWSLIEDPQIEDDDANDYYVMNLSVRLRGLIWQQRTPLALEAEAPRSTAEFEKEVQRWKSRLRGRAGYGRWQHIVKVTNT